jgi:hypothetical protein
MIDFSGNMGLWAGKPCVVNYKINSMENVMVGMSRLPLLKEHNS